MSLITTLFPVIEPLSTGMLQVSDLHEIYYETSGNPNGVPIVACHGGPGGGSTPSMRRYFDPSKYFIILFDQRGCGRSRPHAELRENTTWDLVDDMEKLRAHLGLERWHVFGGSWGSTLALTYAQEHPGHVRSLILRGIFTLRKTELEWFYQAGTSWIYPDAWEDFIAPIPQSERDDLMAAYYKRLTGDDRPTQIEAAKAWSKWEGATVSLFPSAQRVQGFGEENFALAFARIECHYFVNGGFFSRDDHVLANIDKINHLPCTIVQGRYDVVTPMKTAWELKRAWPSARFDLVPDAGHAASDPGITSALVRATNMHASY